MPYYMWYAQRQCACLDRCERRATTTGSGTRLAHYQLRILRVWHTPCTTGKCANATEARVGGDQAGRAQWDHTHARGRPTRHGTRR